MPAKGQRHIRSFIPAAVVASGVGTWDWDVPQDRLCFDTITATMFGLAPELSDESISIQRFIAALHEDDREQFRSKIAGVRQRGGVFIAEYRTRPVPDEVRKILARGRFDVDAHGMVVRGRGIVVDLTESMPDGYADGNAFFTAELEEPSPLDRAADHAIAVRRALDALGTGSDAPLRKAADALLWELGHQIAAELVRAEDAVRRLSLGGLH